MTKIKTSRSRWCVGNHRQTQQKLKYSKIKKKRFFYTLESNFGKSLSFLALNITLYARFEISITFGFSTILHQYDSEYIGENRKKGHNSVKK